MFIIRSLGPRHFKMCVHADLQPLKVSSEKTCNFIKKETLIQACFCGFCEIFKNTFFAEHLRTALSAPNDLRSDKVSRNIV